MEGLIADLIPFLSGWNVCHISCDISFANEAYQIDTTIDLAWVVS